MRLSEAIRLGSLMKPQCFLAFYHDGGSCAFGAAYDAIGRPDQIGIMSFDWLQAEMLASFELCPACRVKTGGSVIPHLNDVHRWTRERIADYVELFEPAPVPSSPVTFDAVPVTDEPEASVTSSGQ